MATVTTNIKGQDLRSACAAYRGDASIGGTQRWDLRGTSSSTLTLNEYTLTKTGANWIALANANVSPSRVCLCNGRRS